MSERIRVLVVDDSEFFGTIVSGELERLYDMEAVQTTNSKDALDRLENERFDCIVSDYDMPDLNGIELFEYVRETGYEAPFFLLTAAGSEEVASRAITAGIDDYFSKAQGEDQFDILGNRIQNIVTKRRAAADLERQRSLHQTLWEVTQDLLHAQNREQICEHVCTGVVSVDRFDFAWVETPDGMIPATAGLSRFDEDSMQRLVDSVDPDLVATTAETGDLTTTTVSLPTERVERTVMVVPLDHRGTSHGTLLLGSEPEASFRAPDRQSLSNLGTTVGHALARVAMRREVEIFRTAVEQAETAIAIVNPDGSISYGNTAFHEITGYENGELEGKSVRCLASDAFGPEEYDALWEQVSGGETVRQEVEQRRKDGGRFVADMSVAPVTVSGDLQQFILVETDITELKSQQQRLQVLNRVVRHNLRNDLNVVKGNISLVIDEIESDRSHEQAERAMQKIDELLEMSEKARLVNRIVEDADESDVTQTEDLGAVVETLVTSLREAYPDADLGADIDGRYDVPGWSMEVCLRELLTNAIEHNDSDEPRVALSATTASVAPGMIAVDVADNGPGIPKVERETLSRGHETDLEHGSSLGLWLVHWITTYIGGDLQIQETDDSGSTVRLVVPYGENVA